MWQQVSNMAIWFDWKSHYAFNDYQTSRDQIFLCWWVAYTHNFTLMYFLSEILAVSQSLNELKKSTIFKSGLICAYIHQGTPCIHRSLFWILNNAQSWACVERHSLLNVNKTAGSMFWCYYWICSYLVNSSNFRERSTSLERCDCRLSISTEIDDLNFWAIILCTSKRIKGL